MNQAPTQTVFELTLMRAATTPTGEHPSLIHLWWRAPEQGDRLVQVYVNDVLYDVSDDPTQRDLWLSLDRSKPQRIELLAVPAASAWIAQPQGLACWSPAVNDVAQVAVLRDERLPIDTQLTLTLDGEPMESALLWSGEVPRSGFGALFGDGAFGFDNRVGPGLGQGQLGAGPLGSDGETWDWRDDALTPGSHSLVIGAQQLDGQPVAPDQMVNFAIDRLPDPAHTLNMQADFTLTWTPSHA